MSILRLLLVVALSLGPSACEYVEEMLPTSREETATTANPVSSNTINAIQDAIVGAKHPSLTLWTFPAPVVTSSTASLAVAPYWVTANAGTGWISQVASIPVGTRITGGKARWQPNGGELAGSLAIEMELVVTRGGTFQILGRKVYEPNSNAWVTVALDQDLTFPYTLADGEALVWRVSHSMANQRFAGLGVTVDRL